MRGSTLDQPVAKPIIEHLPSIYQSDAFTGQFLSGFDDVWAPIMSALDCIDAYVDPLLTPSDFLEWLAGWIGLTISEDWSVEQQRRLLLHAVELFRRRGTTEGLRQEVALYTGAEVTIEESGGTAVSQAPGQDLPGRAAQAIRIVVRTEGESVNEAGLMSLVRAIVPTHLFVETVIEENS